MEKERGHKSGSEWSTRTQLCRPAQTGCRQIEPWFEFRTAVAARKKKANRDRRKRRKRREERKSARAGEKEQVEKEKGTVEREEASCLPVPA